MALTLEGPPQAGQGSNAQYVYWIVMSHPTEEHVMRHNVRLPSEFDRDSFRAELVEAHAICAVDIVETMHFMEPHRPLPVGIWHELKWRDSAAVELLRAYWKVAAKAYQGGREGVSVGGCWGFVDA